MKAEPGENPQRVIERSTIVAAKMAFVEHAAPGHFVPMSFATSKTRIRRGFRRSLQPDRACKIFQCCSESLRQSRIGPNARSIKVPAPQRQGDRGTLNQLCGHSRQDLAQLRITVDRAL